MDRPVFWYDGTCALCRAWVKRWKRATGDTAEYRPFAEGEKRPTSEFVQGGMTYRGAEGVFRLLALRSHGRLLWWYRRVPLFAPVSELVYRMASSCRVCTYKFTKWLVHE